MQFTCSSCRSSVSTSFALREYSRSNSALRCHTREGSNKDWAQRFDLVLEAATCAMVGAKLRLGSGKIFKLGLELRLV
eukprot:2629522-Pleurochrysis_carterae.AAC.1